MDLMNPKSIDAFAEKFLSSDRPLHLLINNAGIMWVPLRRDSRGFESQLATNYLAQFQLTARLWIALKKAGGARVVNVSSGGHRFAPFNFDDPNFLHRDYETLQGYGQSKTGSNLFALELDNRGKKFNVSAYSLCPGSIAGRELAREAPIELFQQMGYYDEEGKMAAQSRCFIKNHSTRCCYYGLVCHQSYAKSYWRSVLRKLRYCWINERSVNCGRRRTLFIG